MAKDEIIGNAISKADAAKGKTGSNTGGGGILPGRGHAARNSYQEVNDKTKINANEMKAKYWPKGSNGKPVPVDKLTAYERAKIMAKGEDNRVVEAGGRGKYRVYKTRQGARDARRNRR